MGALVKAPNKFQEMVRARLRERTPEPKALAKFLGYSDASLIYKRLTEGGPKLSLDFLDDVRSFYQMSVSEMTALPSALWQEVKPLESQLLAQFRDMSELEKQSLLVVLERQTAFDARKSRLGRAMLTAKEQELVDLFARVKRDGVREGVLQTLRGAAKEDAVQDPETPRTTG